MRARIVDEQLSSIADQLAHHGSVFSKTDSLYATVQQHSKSFDLLWKNHSNSLLQINHYFLFYQIPADQCLGMAAFYMIGLARQWLQWLHSTDQLTNWDTFVRKLELRFRTFVVREP